MTWWLFGGFVVGAGLLWALMPALTAPKSRPYATVVRGRDDGFVYWPPCSECGNIAVSCVERIPKNTVPADAYTLACDHGSSFCGTVFTLSRDDIMDMQKKLRRERR